MGYWAVSTATDPSDDFHERPAAVAARKKRDAADRARKYRATRAELGEPMTRQVDAALSEALSFMLSFNRTSVDIGEVHKIATLILVREGAAKPAARLAVAERIRPRFHHQLNHVMPNVHRVDNLATIDGDFTRGDIITLNRINRAGDVTL